MRTLVTTPGAVRAARFAAGGAGVLVGLAFAAGCGGSGHRATAAPTQAPTAVSTPAPSTATAPATSTSATAPGLQAEATAAAAGDIPDNQVFLDFRNATAGYVMRYPEGWAQRGSGDKVVINDKNNIVRVVIRNGQLPTIGAARAELARLAGVLVQSGPIATRIGAAPAVKVVYTTQSAPNAVTGKRVTLVVDRYYLARYYLAHGGKEAIVDLGTPQGVDNVDAYRLMIESFRWR